jgi:hypothetical protein
MTATFKSDHKSIHTWSNREGFLEEVTLEPRQRMNERHTNMG